MSIDRRRFLRQSAAAASGLLVTPALIGCGDSRTQATETSSASAAAGAEGRQLGVALLGLGSYAKGQIAPAFAMTQHCRLTGLITGSPDKLPEWQRKHNIADEHCYSYDTMGNLANDDAIDVVYVITPTSTHKEFVLKAAAAGKHVWCEKPMAMTPADCQEMIDACAAAGVSLAIGYRMLHERNTQDFIALSQNRTYSAIQGVKSYAGYGGKPPAADYWRGQRDMGGGALYDMGVYTINGARYATQAIPEAVVRAEQVRADQPNGVDLTTTYTLRMPGGYEVDGKTSVVEKSNLLRVDAADGWYEMDPMQPYQGVKGKTSDGKVLGPPVPNQQNLQMDDDALAILNGTELIAPGREGLIDVAIIRAIIESAESGQEVAVRV